MKDGKIAYLSDRVMVTNSSEGIITIEDYEYQDNIKEILKTENIIEELKNEENKLNNKIQKNDNFIKQNKSTNKLSVICWGFTIIFAIILGLVANIDKNTILYFGLNGWQTMGIAGGLLTSVTFSPIILLNNKLSKKRKRENNGYKLELEELDKELVKNEEFLNQLKNDKTKDKQAEAKERISDDIHNIHLEKYKEIKKQLMLYYEIGENENKLFKYYNNGLLEEKLKEEYEPEEIEKVKTYFKTKNKK